MAAAVDALIANIAKASPQGLVASKALTTASILKDFDRHAEKLAKQSATLFVSDEAREGMLVFLQKRPPSWTQSRPLGHSLGNNLACTSDRRRLDSDDHSSVAQRIHARCRHRSHSGCSAAH